MTDDRGSTTDTKRIAIIGLGLIGGSIGLALKAAGLPDLQVVGTARTRETLQKAKRRGAIDVDAPTAADAARGASLVIVASPILTIPGVFREIGPVLSEGAVVTDVASTKTAVSRWAREFLPEHANFVGGHPMAGKETAGIDAADGDLFRGRTWVIAPSVDAAEAAVRTVVGLAQLAGADPVFMDPQEHDSYVAAISHLPLLLSSALFSVVFGSAAWPELATLASSGFRDATRLASGSPELAHDIVMTNRENILHWLDRFQEELRRFREVVAAGESKGVVEAFSRAQIERDNYVVAGPPKRDVPPPMETVSLGDMLLGARVSNFLKKQQQIIRDMEAREDAHRRPPGRVE